VLLFVFTTCQVQSMKTTVENYGVVSILDAIEQGLCIRLSISQFQGCLPPHSFLRWSLNVSNFTRPLCQSAKGNFITKKRKLHSQIWRLNPTPAQRADFQTLRASRRNGNKQAPPISISAPQRVNRMNLLRLLKEPRAVESHSSL